MYKCILLSLLIPFSFSWGCDLEMKKTKLCANVTWVTQPIENQFLSAKVVFQNTESELEQIGSFKFLTWMVMPGMEHGGRPLKVTQASAFEYLLEKIYFMGGMSGSWYLKAQVFNKNSQLIEEARYEVQL